MRYSARTLGVALVTVLAPIWTSCGSSKPSPVAPTMTSTPAATVARLLITGGVILTTISQSSQLTATATLSDNTTKDVTADGRWASNDVSVVTISATGVLTVVGFGSTSVSFVYQTRVAGLTVTATPAGTFVIAGRVREPAQGGLANVRVVDTTTGRSTTTALFGDFSIAELPQLQAHLKVAQEGYEPAEIDATQTNVDLPIQRVVRVVAGETTKPDPLAPNDLMYIVGGTHCTDCRLIRVVVTQAGTVHVHVTWVGTGSRLSLFAEGQVAEGATGDLTADVPVNAPREVLMYLGAVPPNSVTAHTPFTFETSMR